MKHYNLYRGILQLAFVLVFTSLVYSCLSSKKEETPLPTATDVNEATIDDSDKQNDAQFIVKAAEISLMVKFIRCGKRNYSSLTMKEMN